MILFVLACAGASGDSAVAGACDSAPTVSWESWGAGFVTENCQTCHASTSANRQGAPDDVVFDTAEEVWAHRDEVLRDVTGDSPTMPPEGGLLDDDRYLLGVWLTCGQDGS